jgi:hypothetical protein
MSLMAEDSRRRRRRWVWGCTGGCLGFMLISFLLIVITMRVFVVKPQRVVHPETFLTPKTQGFVFVKLVKGDPLLPEVVRALLIAEPGGRAVRNKSGEAADTEMVTTLLNRAAPVQIVVIFETGEAGLVLGGTAAAYKYAPLVVGFLRALLSQDARAGQAAFQEYNGARLFAGQNNIVVIRGNNFGFTELPDTARFWVDRLAERRKLEKRADADAIPVPDVPSREELVLAHGRLAGSVPVRFAIVDVRGEAAWILSRFPEGPVREALAAASGEGQAVVSVAGQIESLDADSGGLSLFVECADEASAEKLRAAIEAIAERQAEGGTLGDLGVRLQGEKVVAISAVIDGLPQKAVALVRHLEAAGEEAAQAPVTPPSPL